MSDRKKEILSLLEQEPHDPFLLYALGMEFLSENNFEEAKKYFLKILELQHNHVDTLFRLGQLEQDFGNENLALQWYEKAYEAALQQNKIKTAVEIKNIMEILKF
jgi:tetratricopeptide (TPR) repeat protein